MCGRFVIHKVIQELAKLYQATITAGIQFEGSYNVAPTEQVPMVIGKEQDREITLGRFGRVMTAGGKTFPLINIQSEKAANRKDFTAQRCIVPATGFYEWEKITPKDKQPYFFSPADGGIFSFPGLYAVNDDALAFSILTTTANEIVAPIHNRMPVNCE